MSCSLSWSGSPFEVNVGTVGKVRVDSDGVRAELHGGVPDAVRREIDEGPVAALAGYCEGDVPLHASAVAQDGTAVALLGGQGVGKSTLSFAIARTGTEMVADGAVVVSPSTGLVRSGLRRWKLSDQTLRQFGCQPQDFAHVNEAHLKRYVPDPSKGAYASNRLRVILAVCDGDCERIEDLAVREQVSSLVGHLYMVRQFPPSEHSKLMIRAGELLSRGVTVKRLVRRKTWSTLPLVVQLVRAELFSVMSSQQADR